MEIKKIPPLASKQLEPLLIPIEDIRPHPDNYKVHPPEQIKNLRASLKAFGVTAPIKANLEGVIVAGHGMYQLYLEDGYTHVPVLYEALDKQLSKAYLVADNETARRAVTEQDKLNELLEGALGIPDFDIEAVGFSSEDIDSILKSGESVEVVEDEFNSDDMGESRCKEGDLWQLGRHRLLCGSSTNAEDVKRLMNGERADILFTDPPYGIGTSIANDDLSETELFDFNSKWAPIAYEHTKEDSHLVCFHSTRLFWTALVNLQNSGFKFKRYLTLYKPNDCTFPWHGWILKSESILLFSKGNPEYIEVSPYQHDTIVYNHSAEGLKDNIGGHPCAKPIPFIGEFLKRFSGEKVLDLFLGSGTTLIACEQLNKICYGIDTDPHYCDVILQRWEQFTNQTAKKLS